MRCVPEDGVAMKEVTWCGVRGVCYSQETLSTTKDNKRRGAKSQQPCAARRKRQTIGGIDEVRGGSIGRMLLVAVFVVGEGLWRTRGSVIDVVRLPRSALALR